MPRLPNVMMTPERADYAKKRIGRLTAKIDELTAAIRHLGSRQITVQEHEDMTSYINQCRSSIAARKRWLKELERAGVTL